jgi:hypothetical protein
LAGEIVQYSIIQPEITGTSLSWHLNADEKLTKLIPESII